MAPDAAPTALAMPDAGLAVEATPEPMPDAGAPVAVPEAAPAPVLDAGPALDWCPTPYPLQCVTGQEFHVDEPDCRTPGSHTCTAIPCGKSSPPCPHGAACVGINPHTGVEQSAVCP